ncbi:MAG: C_GCAxxG_C_C family protein, partial [Clostridia bacterium]|nr:C_GCAxxG_C_C family protein [Clostridia bacterium]
MSRADAAKEYFMKGYACAQAVLLAFSDVTGLEAETALKISLPFGGGMGRLRLTCGTVSGAVMVLGTVFSKAEINPENKKEVYAAVQEFSGRFKAENGS